MSCDTYGDCDLLDELSDDGDVQTAQDSEEDVLPEVEPGQPAEIGQSSDVEPVGVTINYYLKAKPKGEVKVQVLKGAAVFAEIKGTADAGLNFVLWNMSRTLSEAEKQGAASSQRARFGGMGAGAQAPSGEYTVALFVDGQKLTTSAVILPDPDGYK